MKKSRTLLLLLLAVAQNLIAQSYEPRVEHALGTFSPDLLSSALPDYILMFFVDEYMTGFDIVTYKKDENGFPIKILFQSFFKEFDGQWQSEGERNRIIQWEDGRIVGQTLDGKPHVSLFWEDDQLLKRQIQFEGYLHSELIFHYQEETIIGFTERSYRNQEIQKESYHTLSYDGDLLLSVTPDDPYNEFDLEEFFYDEDQRLTSSRNLIFDTLYFYEPLNTSTDIIALAESYLPEIQKRRIKDE